MGARRNGGYNVLREGLRVMVLRMLADGPLHGYEIMKRVEEKTRGAWKPAAGTLYPLLDQLRSEGLIEVVRVDEVGVKGGKRVLYSLTDRGWAVLAERLVKGVDSKLSSIVYYFVEGCRTLRSRGFEREASEICARLREGVRTLGAEVERACG